MHAVASRTVIVAALVCLGCALPAAGQTALITTGGGISAGDGGSAGPIVASAGYLTQRKIGFELEFGFTPGLEFPGPDLVIQTPVLPSIFPPTTYDITGRLYTFHTNLVHELPTAGRLRILAVAGGGVATLERRVRIQRPEIRFDFPEIPIELLAPGGFPIDFPVIPALDVRRTISSTGLSLNAGGTIEFRLTGRLGAGLDVRYQHVYLEDGGLDLARITGRVSWRF